MNTETAYDIAFDLAHMHGIDNVTRAVDANGHEHAHVYFTDGSVLVAQENINDDGTVGGTWSYYEDADGMARGHEIDTDGSDDIADLSSEIMHRAVEAHTL